MVDRGEATGAWKKCEKKIKVITHILIFSSSGNCVSLNNRKDKILITLNNEAVLRRSCWKSFSPWQLQVSVEDTPAFSVSFSELQTCRVECWMYVYDEMIFSCRRHHQSHEVDAFGGFFIFVNSFRSHFSHVFSHILRLFQYGNWIIIRACKISICWVSRIFVHPLEARERRTKTKVEGKFPRNFS